MNGKTWSIGFSVAIKAAFPEAKIVISAPGGPSGVVWHIDVTHGPVWLVLQWLDDKQTGVSQVRETDLYGDGPDEILSHASATVRVIELLGGSESPSPSAA